MRPLQMSPELPVSDSREICKDEYTSLSLWKNVSCYKACDRLQQLSMEGHTASTISL